MITIIKIIFAFIIFRYVLKLLSPFLLKYFLKRVEKKMQNNFNNFQRDHVKRGGPKKKKINKDDVGEYIDFEEVD